MAAFNEAEPTDDYSKRIIELIPSDIKISDKCIDICSNAIEKINELYGDKTSETFLKYHSADHSLDVIRRGSKLLQAIEEAAPSRIKTKDYELFLISASFHDMYQLEENFGENEEKSADAAVGIMLNFDYSTKDRLRVKNAILTTAIDRDEKGQICQYMLRKGSKDIIKFVLAMADINGVAMEGVFRMLDDATNLYSEIFNDNDLKNPIALTQFFSSQATFLRQRMACVDEDIAYYFNDKDQPNIKEVMKAIFAPSKTALELAGWMEDPLHLKHLQAYLEESDDEGLTPFSIARTIGKKVLSQMTRQPEN